MASNGSTTGTPLRLCIQQRQRLFRLGLADLLGDRPEFDVEGIAVTGAELAPIAAAIRPDVVVLDVDGDGAEACRTAAAVRGRVPAVRFVALCPPAARLSEAALATFPDRVRRADGLDAVIRAVRAASTRPLIDIVLPTDDPRDSLSPRELDVLALVGSGCTTREISERLAISRKTVENHKQHIFSKLHVRNQAHAVAVAMKTGMITVDGVLDLRDAL